MAAQDTLQGAMVHLSLEAMKQNIGTTSMHTHTIQMLMISSHAHKQEHHYMDEEAQTHLLSNACGHKLK
jgi:hypothetical protein